MFGRATAKKRTSTSEPNEAGTLMIRILAATDAVWLPLRDWSGPRPTNTAEARRLFRRAGVAWLFGGTEQERKEAQRAIEAMAKIGAVVVRRPSKTKAICVRLSDEAEATTRAKCRLPGLRDSWLAAREIEKRGGGEQWVSEFAMSKRDEWPSGQMAIEYMSLWALSRELVESNSTIKGEVRYRLTPRGVGWLDSTKQPEEPDIDGDEAACRFYDTQVVAALDRLSTLTPANPREIGEIPLPASA
jgi:hypothetical protein